MVRRVGEWVLMSLPVNVVGTEMGGFQHITYLEVNKDQLWDDTLMMSGESERIRNRMIFC